MRRLIYWKNMIFLCLAVGIIVSPAYPANPEGQVWGMKKSRHFIIYYQGAPSEYIDRLIKKAEGYYDSITAYLGFKRFNYWTWNNRCKIYLYKDKQEYQKETGIVSWSRAHVNVIKKEIRSYLWQDEFFDTILPHEMGHIVFREFVGFHKKLPLWLDEGVACSQERDNGIRLKIAQFLIGLKLYVPFEAFSDIRNPNLIVPFIFYSQAASMVDFLLEGFGRDRFVKFCRRVRDQADWKESLLSVYKFKDLQDAEKKWKAFLSKKKIQKGAPQI